MKKIILSLLFALAFVTTAFCAEEYFSYKVKFVMKDKTSFVAYLYNSSYDISHSSYTYEQTCTDKGFQRYLNKMNYVHYANVYNEDTMVYQGITLYKNTYKIKIADPDAPNFTFCSPSDKITIDANDILYTVYLGSPTYGQPIVFDNNIVQDMKNNKITAFHTDSYEVCDYFFYTTDKNISAKKIETILKQKKVNYEKKIEMGEYYEKIKSELEKLRIYLFSECSC